MSRGRIKKTESEYNHSAYNENVGAYFELVLRLFGEYFQNKTYSNQPSQVLAQNVFDKKEGDGQLFAIPSNWIWCTIGEIVEVAKNRNIEEELNSKDLINYVDIDSIDNKLYKIREVKQKVVSELSSRARRVLRKGYVVYSLVRPYLNNLAIVEEDKENLIGSTGFAAFRCINVENEFMKFWLLSPFIRRRYLEYMSGFNSPGISSSQFYITPIPLPPIEEQVTIIDLIKNFEVENTFVNKSSTIEQIRAKVNRIHSAQENCIKLKLELTHQLDLVKQLRQAFLREAMQGKLVPQDPNDEPASKLLEKIKAEKEQLIKEKKIKKEKELPPIKPEEIPFEIPKSWVWCRLGKICNELLGGYAFDSTRYSKISNNQVIRLGNVKVDKLLLDASPVFIDDKYVSEVEKCELFPGDILITMTGTRAKRDYLFSVLLDKSDFNQGRLFLNQRVGCFRFSTSLSKDFINLALKDGRLLDPVFESATGAANQANIGVGALKELSIPLPTLSEQKRIVTKLQQLMRYCDELEQSIKQSQTQNEQLLQQVLREALQPDKKYKANEEISLAAEP